MSNSREYISSQQSPSVYYDDWRQSYRKSLYGSILIEDFCLPFSSFLSDRFNDNDFYRIEPPSDKLKSLLLFDDYSYLRSSFDRLLNTIMYNLITDGRTYLEIVTWQDQNDNYVGISLLPIRARWKKKLRNCYLFVAKSTDKKIITFTIKSKNVICFDLKDLDINRNYFRRLTRRLSHKDITCITDLSIDPKMQGKFDFENYRSRIEFSMLKCTHKIYWYGRTADNQHLSESYCLFRSAHLKMLRDRFLKYFIHQINASLEVFMGDLDFKGMIVAGRELPDLELELKRYASGEINTRQLADVVFKI